ncbi:MAG: N4-gp56 family major capsid protein [Christensenellales bacterium]
MADETKLESLINPQVLADMIEGKLVNAMKFTPLCKVDNTLVGQPGDTVTLPQFAYIGDATDVSELADIPISELTASSQPVTVKKVGRGATISDEAVLSGYGNPVGEIGNQLLTSIASKVDNDVLSALDDATLIYPVVSVTPNDINNALVKMGEDFEGDKYLFVGAVTYAALRDAKEWIPASEIAAKAVIGGVVGMIYGCYVVLSNKIATTDKAYIVKPGAVALFMKRGTQVEDARNIVNKSTTFTADKHYAAYLYDSSKVVKLGAATLTTLEVKQDASISGNKASFTVTGYPTNVSYGWKAYAATGLNDALTVEVGDTFDNAAGATHAAFAAEYEAGFKYAAVENKYFQVIYVDAAGKIRGTGNAKIATAIT